MGCCKKKDLQITINFNNYNDNNYDENNKNKYNSNNNKLYIRSNINNDDNDERPWRQWWDDCGEDYGDYEITMML